MLEHVMAELWAHTPAYEVAARELARRIAYADRWLDRMVERPFVAERVLAEVRLPRREAGVAGPSVQPAGPLQRVPMGIGLFKSASTGVGDLTDLDDITREIDQRLNDRAAGDPKLNYVAETIVLAIREQTIQLETAIRERR